MILPPRALTTLEIDDPAMVARQMELVLEGCTSRMLVNRSQADVDTAQRLAENILRFFAQCRQGWRFHLTGTDFYAAARRSRRSSALLSRFFV